MKKPVTITLYLSELKYDVHNKTYLTGRSRQADGNYEQVAAMQSNDDEEDLNQLLRVIGSAYNRLKTEMAEYIIEEECQCGCLDSDEAATNGDCCEACDEGDNILLEDDDDEVLTICLQMPSNYNTGTIGTVTQEAHQYIVNMTVAEWFNITNKADAKEYYGMAAANLEVIRKALSKRVRPSRPEV